MRLVAQRVGLCLALLVIGCGPRDEGVDGVAAGLEPKLEAALERDRSGPIELDSNGVVQSAAYKPEPGCNDVAGASSRRAGPG